MRNPNGTVRSTAFSTRLQASPTPRTCLPAAFDGSIGHRQEYRSAMAAGPASGVEGEQAQVIGLGGAGILDQDDAAGSGLEAAVPQPFGGGDLHGGVLPVDVDDGVPPVRAGRDLRAGPQPGALDPRPPAPARRRRLRPYSTAFASSLVVQVAPSMTSGSPWKAASPVPWTTRPGNACTSSLTIPAASSTGEAVPLPRHNRNSTGSATGEEQNGSRIRPRRSPTCSRTRSSSRPAPTRHRPTGPGRPYGPTA